MEKHYLYIVLTRSNTTISKLIKLIKKDEFTHAAISFDKELKQMYSFGRKKFYNPFIAGFKQENLNKGVYKHCKILPGMIMEVEVSKEQYEKAKELLDQFKSNKDFYKYNYMGLVNSLLNKEGYYDNRFLCSEFVYYVLNSSGVADFKIARNLVRPINFLNLNSKVAYKGDLKEINQSNDDENLKELKVIALWETLKPHKFILIIQKFLKIY